MDAMLLGVVLMQVSRWFTYCHANERWVIRGLVVSVFHLYTEDIAYAASTM